MVHYHFPPKSLGFPSSFLFFVGRGRGENGNQDLMAERAFKYSRIVGITSSLSISSDKAATAEAVKSHLGCIDNKWAALYLLTGIFEDQRKEKAETWGNSDHFASTISGPTSMGDSGFFPRRQSCGKW